ncbi:MAG: hypothetical protein LBP54_02580 [Campylobacteraceae bacterium]|jgi:hypothetical protein|nr:hypothetical protein [Campylobacteraceae bacterium]
MMTENDIVLQTVKNLQNIGKKLLQNGQAIVYRDDAVSEEYMIVEYPNGRKLLIDVDMDTGEEIIIKELQ